MLAHELVLSASAVGLLAHELVLSAEDVGLLTHELVLPANAVVLLAHKLILSAEDVGLLTHELVLPAEDVGLLAHDFFLLILLKPKVSQKLLILWQAISGRKSRNHRQKQPACACHRFVPFAAIASQNQI